MSDGDDEHIDDERSGDDAPPPRSSGSRACGVIGCLLVIGVLAGLAVGAFALNNALEPIFDRFLWAPHEVVREYLMAYEAGDSERARRFLCEDIRAGRPLDPGAPHGVSAPSAYVDDTFPYPRPGGRWAIYYAVNVPGRVTDARAQALLEREEEGWRICAFE
jgi:hypothetical protein